MFESMRARRHQGISSPSSHWSRFRQTDSAPSPSPKRMISSASSARAGHDFRRISVHPPAQRSLESGRPDLDTPEPDEEIRLLAIDRSALIGGGIGAGIGTPLGGALFGPVGAMGGALLGGALGAGIAAAAGPKASLSIGGDRYVDTATESRKNVSFNVTWSGGKKEDYIIVNWVKGYMKNSKGKPFKAKLYGKLVDINFASWMVDSVDADPAYWSKGGVRWRYIVDGPHKFHATDSPGQLSTGDGVGAEAKLDFRTAVYRSADVPTTTTGSLSATPITPFRTWEYHAKVLGGGKFEHK